MSVYVSIATSNDGVVHDVTISNIGPIPGHQFDDMRRYHWRETGGREGVVEHRRSAGLVALVCVVLDELG